MIGGMSTQSIAVENWGLVPYAQAYDRQLEQVKKRIAGEAKDTLVMVEHPAVYTIGARMEASTHLRASPEWLQQNKVEVCQTNRGGDITLHAPGQLVVYPIVKLEKKDLHGYLRDLEDVIIRTLSYLGLASARAEGKTGVWVKDKTGERKIAAIGVAVKQWVTYHGVAINLNNDLALFGGIVPCGLAGSAVSSVEKELGADATPTMDELKAMFAKAWGEIMG